MQGQALDHDSDLFHLWGQERIPDARGVYLRGKNHNRDPATGDPNGNRALGDYMGDQICSHTHVDEGHGHEQDLYTNTSHGQGGSAPCRGGGHTWGREHVQGSILTGHANIQPTGGSETRPRSIVVNTYIKVRQSTRAAAASGHRGAGWALEITPEIMDVMTRRPEFQRAVENAVTEMMNRQNR